MQKNNLYPPCGFFVDTFMNRIHSLRSLVCFVCMEWSLYVYAMGEMSSAFLDFR